MPREFVRGPLPARLPTGAMVFRRNRGEIASPTAYTYNGTPDGEMVREQIFAAERTIR